MVRADLQTLMRDLHAELGTTTVFVTHDISEAFALADRIMILREGATVAQEGKPEEILAAPADAFVRSFIGVDAGQRTLRIRTVDGVKVAVDAAGRVAGLVED